MNNKLKTFLSLFFVLALGFVLIACTPKKFTVTFDTDGGTAIAAVEVTEDEKVSRPTDPTKDGFDFNEWQLDGERFDFETPITADITLKATWTSATSVEVTFTVTLPADTPDGDIYMAGNFSNFGSYPDWNPGSEEGALKLTRTGLTATIKLTLSISETKLEYKITRGSWDSVEQDADGVGIDNRELVVSAANTTVNITVGSWEDINKANTKLTVQFDSNGGSIIDDILVDNGGKVTEPAAPTRPGFTFKAWQLNGVDFDFDTEITEDIILKAVWEITDADLLALDKENLTLATTTFNVNGTITLPETGDNGSTITWVSSDTAAIDVATGAVTLPSEAGTKVVTLTATLTKGTATDTKEFEITLITADQGSVLNVPGLNALSTLEVDAEYSGVGVVLTNDVANTLIYVGTENGPVMISYFGLEIEGIDFESFEADDVVTFSGTVNKSTGGAQARAKFLTPTALTLNTSIAYDKVEVEPLVYADIATLLTQENYELLGSIVTVTITLSVEKNPSYHYFVGYDVSGSTRAGFYLHDVSHLEEGKEYTLTTFIAGTSNDSIGLTIFRFSGLIFTDDVPPVIEKVTVTLMDGETTLDTLEVVKGETADLPTPTKPGFVFEGWFTDSDLTLAFNETTALDADITLYAKYVEGELTIADILLLADGTEVEFTGIVTGFTDYSTEYSNYDKIWVEDEEAAIVLYRNRFADGQTPADLKIGDELKVSGKTSLYNGGVQIAQTDSNVEILSSENTVPVANDITNIDDITVDKQSSRVNLSGIVKTATGTNGRELTITVDGKDIVLRSHVSEASHVVNTKLLTITVGEVVNLSNVFVDWSNGPRLIIISVDQIEVVEVEKVTVTLMDGETTIDTLEVIKGEVATLPTPTKDFHEFIGWYTDAELEDAYVETTELDEDTTLYSKWIEIDYTEVTAYYDGETTNMDEGNNAELLNLDPLVFEVLSTPKSYQSSFINHVGLSKDGDFRLYADINYTTKSTVIFQVSAGNVITKIEIEFVNSTNNAGATLTLGAAPQTLTGVDVLNTTKTFEELSIDGFSIRALQDADATSNGQVRIKSIKITYEEGVATSEFTPIPIIETTFDLNYTDSTPLVHSFEPGDALTMPSAPTRLGYDFVGWFEEAEGTTEFNEEGVVVNEAFTVYAKWEIQSNEALLALAKTALTLETTTFTEDGTITLPEEGLFDVAVTWASNNAAINVETGAVTLPVEPGTLTVTLTGTLTLGEESDTKEFEITLVVADPNVDVEEHTYTLTVVDTGLTASSYSSIDIKVENGKWHGSTNKSGDNMGTRASDAIEFTADDGYYIHAIKLSVISASGSARNVKIGETTIVSGVTSSNPVETSIIELDGLLTTIKLVPSGALQYEYVTVVIRSK